jgi:LPXTG-motif cell wall-anchored protein
VKTKQVYATAIAVGAIGVLGGLASGGIASAAPVCAQESYQWDGEVRLKTDGTTTFDTGVAIPGPTAGETLTITSSSSSSYDRYPSDGSAGNRIDAGQMHESWGIAIGGANFGGLTADAPNGPADGAPDEFFSGMVTGSFGTGPTQGGSLVLRHASLYGFSESPNSINAAGVSLTVERCSEPPGTTPPTTAVETTPPTEPPTTAPETTEPSTSVEDTTTSVESNPPGPGPSVSADVVSPSTASSQVLPATGSGSGALLLVASLFAMAGMGLLIVRRRPAGN